MKQIDQATLDQLCQEAETAPRRRAHLNLHEDLGEDLQRLLIAIQSDSYFRPHRHPEDYKKETIVVLQGRCACYTFHDDGTIDQVTMLDSDKGAFLCEMPDRQWHTLVCLADNTVVLEFKKGPYEPLAPENFAPWAPEENTEASSSYQASLKTALR